MDQVKVYLAVLKKHHFWPLAVVVVLVGLYAWKAGAANFDAMFAQNSSTLNSAFSSVNAVANTPQHPNEFFIDEVKRLNTVQTKDVMAAWQRLYDHQKQVLTWPKEFEEIGRLKPTAPIRMNLRQIVLNYFHLQFPKLFDIVDLREEKPVDPAAAAATAAPAAAPAGRMGSGTANKPEVKGLVVWPAAEREKIVNAYRWSSAPSAKQIRYAQEDYWVYQALLTIISETNRGARDNRNAAIKMIEALDIAQAVPAPNDQAFPVPDGTVTVEEDSKPAGRRAIGSAVTEQDLEDGRYVSADGRPLASPSSDNKEFKLMPIRMRLIMDQRRLPDLLVACANSRLPVDVQRVQYRPSESRSSGGGGRRGGMGRGAAAPPRQMAAAPIQRGPVSTDPLLDLTPDDQLIEIRGLIYIFNPPDLGDLAEATDETEENAEEAVEPEADGPAAVIEEPAADEPAAVEPAAEEPAAEAPAATSAEEGAAETEPAPDEPGEPESTAEPDPSGESPAP